MAQILNSGKDGNQRYSDLDLTKFCPALDDITLLQNLQNAYEETQGYSLGNNKGNPDSIDINLDDITEVNVSNYNKNLAQLIQTYVANGSYLDVDGASTANNIILTPRKIADIISPNTVNYSKSTSLPFAYRNNLRFVFRATLTNTGATQFSIKDNALTGLVGAKDITTETGANLIGGEIITGKFYTIVLTGTGGTQKGVLIGPNQVPQATETVAGIALLPKQITIANNVSDATNDIDFSAGVFQFSDGTGQAVATTKTKQLDATWVAGSAAGGLDTGAKANSTKYYCYAIYNPTTSTADNLFSASATSPTLPSGYTKSKYLGCIMTDASGVIRPFKQTGQQFYLVNKGTFTNSGDYLVTGNYGTSKVNVTTLAPVKTGIIVNIRVIAGQTSNAQDRAWVIKSSLEADVAPIQVVALPAGTDLFNLILNAVDNRTNAYFQIPTEDAVVWYRAEQANDANSSFIIITQGWIDTNI